MLTVRRTDLRSIVLGLLLSVFVCASVQAQSLPNFTELVEDNVPAIVNVSTTRKSAEMSAEQRQYLEELRRYFDREGAPELELPSPDGEERGANGSGFITSKDGYIVTNHHVVDGAETITIILNDQREFSAKVIGTDPNSDLALLKIEADNLPVVTLGDSSKLRVGEWVLAIGSPFGLQYSVAAGIISYMGRSLPTDGSRYVSYIQTDVAINPGHSGGPLLNLDGEVIGINSQIFTNSGGSIGLSFAIPVDVAKNVITQLRDHGSVQRGWLGVAYENVSQSLAEAFNLQTPHGALINRVIDGSPAQDAGIEVGDIVVNFAGSQIRTGEDLPYFVGLLMPGSEVSLDVIRNGENIALSLTLGELETEELAVVEEELGNNRLGLEVRALNESELEGLGLKQAVIVLSVSEVAAEADLMIGDVIISINGEDIASQDALDKVALELPVDKLIPVLVIRGNAPSFITLKISE